MSEPISRATGRHRLFQRSRARSRRLMTAQQIFEEATRVLLTEFNLTPEQIMFGVAETDLQSTLGDDRAIIEQCESLFNITSCDRNSRYRTIDGTCNNLEHPSWGMAGSCFERLLDPAYADGTSTLRTARSGRPLPSARRISLEIHAHLNNPTDYVTHMFMQWGQFLDHDISLSPLNSQGDNNQPPVCCPVEDDNHAECMPILLEEDDPFFSPFELNCLENVRTEMCSTCTLGSRQQINQLTAYIDASEVYGISLNDSRGLRTLDGTGRLRSQTVSDAGELLPESNIPADDSCSFQHENLNCFAAGDQRVNQHPALTSLHILFIREHNRLAQRLRELNPGWDDERLYQEARRILGAQMQMITYAEFLPLVIGPERMEWFDLSVRRSGYTQYDNTCQATLVNSFSTAAFRFGHSLINGFFAELTSDSDSGYLLREMFLFPFGLYEGQMERVLLGLSQSPAQKFDRYMVRDVTNHLYQMRGNETGLDLASLNVLRGRDHGIPGYTEFVRFCGGPQISSFRDLDRLFRRGVREIFQRIYESVEDIDLFSGGLAERPNQGAVVGPTFTCIVGVQFYHLKYGDRFYFEHGGQTGSFTEAQLTELRKTTLAKIICENTEITEIQRNVMRFTDNRNPTQACSQIPAMDLNAWRG